MTTFHIRDAVLEDAKALGHLSEKNIDLPWYEKDFCQAIENSLATVVVAEDAEGLCGYVVLYHAADEGEVPSVAVDGRARKRGIGKALMQEAFSRVEAQGVKKIFLEVRAGNLPALALYESLGFLQVHIRKNFYTNPTEDAYLMMCLIG